MITSNFLLIFANQSYFIKLIEVWYNFEFFFAIFKASLLISEANTSKLGLSLAIEIAIHPEPVPKSIKLRLLLGNSKTFSTSNSVSGLGSKTF